MPKKTPDAPGGRREEDRSLRVGEVVNCFISGTEQQSFAVRITYDVSQGGACLCSGRDLKRGLELTIFTDTLGEKPKRAVVCWSEKIGEEFYKVGIKLARS